MALRNRKNMNYGIRIIIKDGTIYDVDTPYPRAFRDEINKFITK